MIVRKFVPFCFALACWPAGNGDAGSWVSGRVLLLVSEVFFFIVQAHYSAAIVLFLLRPPASSVRSLHGLLHSDLRVAAEVWVHTRRQLQVTRLGRDALLVVPSAATAPHTNY